MSDYPMEEKVTPPRCTGHNRQGEPCQRYPSPGCSVCWVHGAAAPQTRAAGQRKLLAGADFAIDYLVSMLEPRPPCPTCGRSDADRDPVVVRAAQVVLDRAGYGPHATLTLQRDDEDLSQLSTLALIAATEETLAGLKELAAREQARENASQLAINGETVDTPLGPDEEEL